MSTQGLDGFILELKNFGEVIMPKEHAGLCKRIAFEVVRGIDKKMPVKTGLARGNNQVSNGEPITTVIDRLDKTGTETVAKAYEEIQKAEPMKKVIWESNNVPYIEELENGSSQQAPQGMVELTLLEIKAKADAGVI